MGRLASADTFRTRRQPEALPLLSVAKLQPDRVHLPWKQLPT